MARKPRIAAKSGIYHVILRGNNRQSIFEDIEDKKYFISKLRAYRDKLGFHIYAYCLMDNHVHLLIQEQDVSISEIIKRLAGSYAYWFNRKYDRIGHLFQDRFKSEPVENDKYFLTVLRYIHTNPVKAGMVQSCSEYIFSSYNEYVDRCTLIDKSLCEGIIGADFALFHNQKNDDECMEMTSPVFRFITDSEAIKYIKSVIPSGIVDKLFGANKQLRDEYIRLFRKRGISIKQISRLTGLSVGIIARQKLKFICI